MATDKHTCYSARCDLCGTVLGEDHGDGDHHASPIEARAAARDAGWEHLSDDRLICTADDGDHQATIATDAALKALM